MVTVVAGLAEAIPRPSRGQVAPLMHAALRAAFCEEPWRSRRTLALPGRTRSETEAGFRLGLRRRSGGLCALARCSQATRAARASSLWEPLYAPQTARACAAQCAQKGGGSATARWPSAKRRDRRAERTEATLTLPPGRRCGVESSSSGLRARVPFGAFARLERAHLSSPDGPFVAVALARLRLPPVDSPRPSPSRPSPHPQAQQQHRAFRRVLLAVASLFHRSTSTSPLSPSLFSLARPTTSRARTARCRLSLSAQSAPPASSPSTR